jgi:hypothetical protein
MTWVRCCAVAAGSVNGFLGMCTKDPVVVEVDGVQHCIGQLFFALLTGFFGLFLLWIDCEIFGFGQRLNFFGLEFLFFGCCLIFLEC